jgi:hypothetical protein
MHLRDPASVALDSELIVSRDPTGGARFGSGPRKAPCQDGILAGRSWSAGAVQEPIAFALRDLVPGVDLDVVPQPGIGAAIWLHATDVQAIHDALVTAGRTIVSAPIDGPFGRTFTFADPNGYQITLHDRG